MEASRITKEELAHLYACALGMSNENKREAEYQATKKAPKKHA